MTASPPSYYQILQVPRDASPAQITAAYRELARRHHPDRNPAADATATMQAINEAYETLRDSEKRAVYDRRLALAGKARLLIRRDGAPVGIARKLNVVVDGEVVDSVAYGRAVEVALTPGEHRLQIRLDAARSPEIRVVCRPGQSLRFACGAGSIFGSLLSPRAYYLRRV